MNFDNGSARLRPEFIAILDNAAATLKEWGEIKVEVAGHTDSAGTDKYNLGLSQRRAEAVRDYLIRQGVAADRLTAKGYGESMPVADNKTAEGRYRNRRVELIPQQKRNRASRNGRFGARFHLTWPGDGRPFSLFRHACLRQVSAPLPSCCLPPLQRATAP